MNEYYDRYVERDVERKLRSSGALVIEGPKFCGKTTTAMRYAASSVKLDSSRMISIASINPRSILAGDTPRVIDEWQTVPDLWNEVRSWIDEKQEFGQIILTGSATPADKTQIHHSGAGRIARLKMKPMSLFEAGDSNGEVSLSALFDGDRTELFVENPGFELKDMAHLICRGGWPLSVISDKEISLDVTRNYYEGLFNFEYSENETFRNKKREVLRMVLRSYARNISTGAPVQTIRSDVMLSNNRTMDTKTIDDYLEALRDMFIIEDMESWNPNRRSKTVVRTTPTRHFVDTSIAAAVLNISPDDLMRDLNTFGLFFEDMAVRDLGVYAAVMGGNVKHYRDSSGLECDAIIHLPDARWAAVEVKLGGEKLIEEGAANLRKLESVVDDGEFAFSMILTATGAAYRRSDGIYVVPLNCLKA